MGILYYIHRIEHRLTNYLNRNQHAPNIDKAKQLLSNNSGNQQRTILYVCTGNICRSAYAHYALKKLLKENGISDVNVVSAGVSTTPGKRADKTATKVAEKRQVDLTPHITSLIYRNGLCDASIILIMEPGHKKCIMAIEPSVRDKIFYTGLLSNAENDAIVRDPYGRSEERFEECFDILDQANANLIEILGKDD